MSAYADCRFRRCSSRLPVAIVRAAGDQDTAIGASVVEFESVSFNDHCFREPRGRTLRLEQPQLAVDGHRFAYIARAEIRCVRNNKSCRISAFAGMLRTGLWIPDCRPTRDCAMQIHPLSLSTVSPSTSGLARPPPPNRSPLRCFCGFARHSTGRAVQFHA
jgi:hypothetical protein